ncbi:hypothetical protein [Borrelia sp. RT1S]|uniref:hypothetical protein n=1 Tax=Borrelia sp. RT1S TaxID=2898580 RepID=UPI001E5821CB|nr:hypothetical protein [Borrelia sp. RT1S]UGQ17803.1 hypothetical protein LSO05_05075 [Borrelia sp. RT1S]
MNIFSKLWGFLVAACLICFYSLTKLLRLTKALRKGQANIIRKEKSDALARKHYDKTLKEFIREFNKRK